MPFSMTRAYLLCVIAVAMTVCVTRGGDTVTVEPQWRDSVRAVLGRPESTADDVATYVRPRDDIDVTVNGMGVPASAGVESRFSFFKCSCGKMRAAGQICCTEDESNDVLDALRGAAALDVAAISPMFLDARPRMVLVRFQGEGEAGRLAESVNLALKVISTAQSTTRP